MKLKLLFLLVGTAAIISLGFINVHNTDRASNKPVTIHGTAGAIAVLELFTSEGCISCPSADRLLPELARYDSNIITLSYHVDYWDRLGWKDPFSSRDFSNRQKEYAKQFRLTNIYTPQLVINGAWELVGNVRSKAELTIQKALAQKASTAISIGEPVMNNEQISFTTNCTGEFENTEIEAALVQRNAEMKVNAGENIGATLTHTNIVRVLQKQTTAAENEFQLQLPKSLSEKDWILVVMVRQKKDLKITGAAMYQPQIN